MNIIVDNLPDSVTKDDLKSTFEIYGRVNSVILKEDNSSGIVEMPLRSQAVAVIQYLQGSTM